MHSCEVWISGKVAEPLGWRSIEANSPSPMAQAPYAQHWSSEQKHANLSMEWTRSDLDSDVDWLCSGQGVENNNNISPAVVGARVPVVPTDPIDRRLAHGPSYICLKHLRSHVEERICFSLSRSRPGSNVGQVQRRLKGRQWLAGIDRVHGLAGLGWASVMVLLPF